jgi:hypothetical protein
LGDYGACTRLTTRQTSGQHHGRSPHPQRVATLASRLLEPIGRRTAQPAPARPVQLADAWDGTDTADQPGDRGALQRRLRCLGRCGASLATPDVAKVCQPAGRAAAVTLRAAPLRAASAARRRSPGRTRPVIDVLMVPTRPLRYRSPWLAAKASVGWRLSLRVLPGIPVLWSARGRRDLGILPPRHPGSADPCLPSRCPSPSSPSPVAIRVNPPVSMPAHWTCGGSPLAVAVSFCRLPGSRRRRNLRKSAQSADGRCRCGRRRVVRSSPLVPVVAVICVYL